jgi:hypothetical protein
MRRTRDHTNARRPCYAGAHEEIIRRRRFIEADCWGRVTHDAVVGRGRWQTVIRRRCIWVRRCWMLNKGFCHVIRWRKLAGRSPGRCTGNWRSCSRRSGCERCGRGGGGDSWRGRCAWESDGEIQFQKRLLVIARVRQRIVLFLPSLRSPEDQLLTLFFRACRYEGCEQTTNTQLLNECFAVRIITCHSEVAQFFQVYSSLCTRHDRTHMQAHANRRRATCICMCVYVCQRFTTLLPPS